MGASFYFRKKFIFFGGSGSACGFFCGCVKPRREQEHNGFENAQVCSGGVDLWEVTSDLESVKMPGLYFAGEILDVDGRCGGYNLQWAWTSGAIAGRGACR